MIKFLSIEANDKGEYLAEYVRFDIFNVVMSTSSYVDPSSGYYGSTLAYVSMLDFINGSGDNGAPYQNTGAVSDVRIDKIDYSMKELGAKVLVISGWTMMVLSDDWVSSEPRPVFSVPASVSSINVVF